MYLLVRSLKELLMIIGLIILLLATLPIATIYCILWLIMRVMYQILDFNKADKR